MKIIEFIKTSMQKFFSFIKYMTAKNVSWIRSNRLFLYFSLAVVIGLVTLGVILYYILFPSRGYFHSDSTDTLMWAESMVNARWIYNLDFAYAAYLPFGGSLLMIPFVAIFGVSMISHVLGMSLFFIIFFSAIIFFCRSIQFSWMWSSITAFVISLGVAGGDKIREIFYGHVIYYSLGILFVLVGLGLIFRMQDKAKNWFSEKKKSGFVLYFVLGSVFFLLASLNGLQALTIFIVPVLGGFFLEMFLDGSKPFFSKANRPFLLTFGVILFGTFLGIFFHVLLALKVPQGYADAYSSYSAPSQWLGNLQKLLEHWFTLIGVDVKYFDPIKSIDSLVNLIRILFGFVIVIIPFVAIIKYSKLANSKVRVIVITHWILTFLIMLGYIFGFLSSASWRLSPVLASSIIVSVVYLESLFQKMETKRLAIVFMAPLVIFGLVMSIKIVNMPHDYNLENGNYDGYYLAQELENLDLTYGYSTFWRANLITVVSDSNVKVRSITDSFEIYHYQSELSWYEEQEGQDYYFVLLTYYEYQKVGEASWYQLEHEEVILNGPHVYYVLIFSENIF
ncbi:MAG: hypothetical protein RBR50_00515 [Candidatus Izemoplasmatales bacterium]|nr:hypothetical protein [Candidatus Izemoplasmatales bacterium]